MNLFATGSQTAIIAGGGLLLTAAAIFLIGGDDAHKRIRERIASIREVKSTKEDPSLAGLLNEPEKQRLALRIAHRLGYRTDLPKPYGPSLSVIVPVAIVLGLIVFRLSQAIVSPLAALGIGLAVALAATTFYFRRKNKAYRSILFRQIPDMLSLMLRAVRAGLPVAEAIKSIARESMAPTRQEFNRVAAETALGMPIELTLQRLFVRTGIQEYAFFSVVIGLHGQTGGNLSETIENLADTVRRRVAMAGKARALAAEGRLSAIVVGGLPFVVGVLISFMNPGYMREFTNSSNGRMLIVAFFVLLSMGLFTTHLLVQRSTTD